MTDDQKQRYASILRQVGAGLATVYGLLTLSGVTAKEPTWFTAVLVALGPFMQLLEHSNFSPGGPTPAIQVDSGPPPAPVTTVTLPSVPPTVTLPSVPLPSS